MAGEPEEVMAGEGYSVIEVDATPVMGAGTLSALMKAEIDMQITTAKAYPRSLTKFHGEVIGMATLNQEVAGSCMYVLPRGGKKVEGPSARLAEIVLSAWGNARGGARIVDEDKDFVTAQGFCHDLERNVAISFEVRRRITDSKGKRYNVDMIGVTANAAASIAFRNAVFKVVPKAYWNQAYKAARLTLRGDMKTLADRRTAAIEAVKKVGVSVDNMLSTLGVQGIEDIGLDELVTLRGILNAIEEGDTTAEQAFAPKKADPPAGSQSPGMQGLKAAVGAEEPKAETETSPAPDPAVKASAPSSAEASVDPYPTIRLLKLNPKLDAGAFQSAASKAATVEASNRNLGFDEALAFAEKLTADAMSEHHAMVMAVQK